MTEFTPCFLPKFDNAIHGPKRPMAIKTKGTPVQSLQLLSAWHQGRLSSLLQATWALVLRCYTGSEDICFGYQRMATDCSDIANLSTMRIAIHDGETLKAVIGKAKGGGSPGSMSESRTTVFDGDIPFNTTLLLRNCCTSSIGNQPTYNQSALAITLPDDCRARLQVKVLPENIGIFLEWWNQDMSMEQMKGIANVFENLLTKILAEEDMTIGEIDYFTEKDWRRVSNWNSSLPESCDRCIHEVIHEQVLLRPEDEAICAWDGSLTYSELDRLASTLACHLQSQGVGPEAKVVLCFEKSKWNTVAMLGVLKAGGAFVPLDPTHPTARLQALVKTVQARIMLCSSNHSEYLKQIVDILIPLSDDSLRELSVHYRGAGPLPGVKSDNAAYVIFTSGSTGEPKGVLLEHRSYCSSAIAHAGRFDIVPRSRLLQFAAHTFDASLPEILTPLMRGSCVCVPSEEARLNDIVKVINDMGVDHMCFTPSFIEFIDPSSVPKVKTVILAGEAMSTSHIANWSNRNLINGYGPTEGAVCAAINSGITEESECRNIGFAAGVRSWIVNPGNHDQLVPVGCPGELLLEGPTLARGYINNPQKTDEAFIYDPAWSKAETGCSGRRFYKTGDLVRYSTDAGCLTYIGRKDAQIKLYGQRIELGEIENHLSVDERIKHCMVLFPNSGFAKGKIVAIVSLSTRYDDRPEFVLVPFKLLDQRTKASFATEARQRLDTRLPKHMIPSLWLCLETLPFLTSGKLDRKSVASWVGSMEQDPNLQLNKTDTAREEIETKPENETESQLVSVWSRILNIPVDQIGSNDSFLGLGGDSIAAITCSSHCKKRGIGLTVQDILHSKSIRELASRAKAVSHSAVYQETIEEPFDLSPIQKIHFWLRKEGQGYFNQSILTRLSMAVDANDLRHAIEILVMRHSMLRARFTDSSADGCMRQRITQDITGSYHWCTHNVKSSEEAKQIISESQARMNSVSGPVLAVDLFNIDGKEFLLSMVAHHLVVDIVSWRIILEDLEDLLLNPQESVSQNSSLPFQTWCRLQADKCQITNDASFDVEDFPAPDFAYWGMEDSPIIYGDAACETFEIDAESTSLLLRDCHKGLQTEPVDIFLAVLLHSFGQTFKDHPSPVIHNEGHGREVWDPEIDISRTVGWFTTLYPIFLSEIDLHNPHQTVIRVKDIRRRALDNGREDFARRILAGNDEQRSQHYPMEISFNYVGQHRDLQREDGLFQLVEQMAGETSRGGGAADFGEETPRFALFEISAMVVQDRLRFSFSFNRYMLHQRAIRDWISQCRNMLTSIGEELRYLSPRLTLSDFPMLSLTYESLEVVMTEKLPSIGIDSPDLVEDIYPCSRLQQGVLLSRSRDSSLYAVHGTFEVRGVGNGKPDPDRLKLAWQKVVSHHALLRTVFVENLTSQDLFCQVVLKDFIPQPVYMQCSDDDDVLQILDSLSPVDYHQHKPGHQFSICQTTSGGLFCRLELSHAAMDGASISILIRDLELAYCDALVATRRPLFKDFMRYLLESPQQAGLDYWCSYLRDIQPCNFPVLHDGTSSPKRLRCLRLNFEPYAELRKFSEANGITISTAFNVAWGLTLRSYCGSDEVCFSYMASLRDLPVDAIESAVGPIINLLACRMKVLGNSVVKDVLHQVQNDYMESLPYRHSSLIDIQHALQVSDQALFNTGLSYQKLPARDVNAKGDVQFVAKGSIHDPAEFPVFVNVEVTDDDAQIELNYWTTSLTDDQAEYLASTFLHSLKNIIQHQDAEIYQLDGVSERNMEQIQTWNRNIPEPVDNCVHEVLNYEAEIRPNAPAVASCDGNLTYTELQELSSRLAGYLTMLGVGPGVMVPIDFEKSVWVVVTILAVFKAGGSCAPLRSDHSSAYFGKWMVDNGIQVALTSSNRAKWLEGTIPYVVTVDSSLFECLSCGEGYVHRQTIVSERAYVFTAGSSDDSRHVVIDHGAILARAEHFAKIFQTNPETRLFQYAACTSDLFLQEVFGTLIHGGCIFIAPDDSRKQVSTLATEFGANLISITPSIAAYVRPSDVSGVKTVALNGESLSEKVRNSWCTKTELHSLYGSVEGSSTCIHKLSNEDSCELREIGPSSGCISWVVDPSNHNRLLPIGCIGELLIEGPMLACGYLDDEARTDNSFIEDPDWISAFQHHATGDNDQANIAATAPKRRMFKTGDLVRYGSDGSLVYVGKKDERARSPIDTWQIADNIESILPPESHCAVEWITCYNFDGEKDTEDLAVFVFLENNTSIDRAKHHPLIEQAPLDFQELIATVHAHLSSCLPSSQVPSFYFPVSEMPLDPLGKLNRHIMREKAQGLPRSDQLAFNIRKFSEFWRSRLADPTSPEFPPLPPVHLDTVRATGQLKHSVQIAWGKGIGLNGVDQKSGILAAWALTLSAYTNSDDVIFGELVTHGRLGLPDVSKRCEQFATTVPRRFQIDRSSTAAGLIKDAKEHLVEASPFQQSSLQRIKKLSADASRACEFNNLISILQTGHEQQEEVWTSLGCESCTYPLTVLCNVSETGLELNAFHDEKVMAMLQVEALLIRFAHYLEVLSSGVNGQKEISSLVHQGNQASSSLTTNTGYWKEYLTDLEPCLFPSLWQGMAPGKVRFETLRLNDAVPLHAFSTSTGTPVSHIFQLAWGLVLRCYTGSEEACFAYSVSESDMLGGDPNAQSDPSTKALICRLNLRDDNKIEKVLQASKTELDRSMKYHAPLAQVQQELGFGGDAPLFNTALSCHEVSRIGENGGLRAWPDSQELIPSKYRIAVHAEICDTSVEIGFGHSTDSVSNTQISDVIDCFKHLLDSITDQIHLGSVIGDLDFFTEQTCQRVREWNATLPERPEGRAHEIIEQQTLDLPVSAPAVCSWDAELTYSQLEAMAARLAKDLVARGVKPETFVALCFEKSAWAVVAQLAVLKAGGAFASLDPTHPEARLRSLATDLGAHIILCSRKYHDQASKICSVALSVDEDTIANLPTPSSDIAAIRPSPENAAYAIFTSGTTGKPKATVLEHVALATASSGLAEVLNMDPNSRAMQFSSYTFDVSVLETILTLMAGGCICIPSEEERMNDLSGAIRRMKANFISVTPAITNTLEPQSVPSLATIITGGDKINASHIERWADRCVINAYGPSESTIVATASVKVDREGMRINDDPNSIGAALCGRTWVVDPHNHHRLVPVGAVGELVLEGSNVARGYLNNERKTNEAFIKDPDWIKHAGLHDVLKRRERMYRTGDLVRYNPDGTLTFISRKDTQLKVNGIRVEAEGIENQCIQHLPEGTQVAVDMVVPKSNAVAKGLAMFFTVGDIDAQSGPDKKDLASRLLQHLSKDLVHTVQQLQGSLAETLPMNLIPKYFFPVRYLPFTTAGKLDRRGLRDMAESLPKEKIRLYIPSSTSIGSKQVSEDGMEGKLRSLWEQVLDLTPGSVGAEDNFFGLGGDSYSAMRLVGIAQSHGMSLTVANIFKCPLFMDMAKSCGVSTKIQATTLSPFRLLPESVKIEDVLEEAADQCRVNKGSIADVYPCSPVQEGLLILSIKQRGAYIAQPTFKLADGIDIERFKAAWEKTVNQLDILRTRILHTENEDFLQVVLQEAAITWSSVESLDALPQDNLDLPQHNGGMLTGYTIVESGTSSERYFVWTVHHALYDGWTVPLILRRVEQNYSDSLPEEPTVPYGLFIEHLTEVDISGSDQFWMSYLSSLSSSPFPQNKNPLPNAVRAGNSHSNSLGISLNSTNMDLTLPVLIRAAWAIVVSTHTGSFDVCYGETLAGRNINLPGITEITGPTLTTVPTRIQVDNEQTIAQYLKGVHHSTAEMIPHQHSGLQHIRKLSSGTAAACEFQNLLVIQSDEGELREGIWTAEGNRTSGEFFTHPLVMECKISKSTVLTTAHHDELVVDSWLAQKLIDQFRFVLSQLLLVPRGDGRKVGELELFSPQDKEQVSQWNSQQPVGVDKSIHDVISEKCFAQPEAMAACDWDGKLSYRELYEAAVSFAKYLSSRGIGNGAIVPICVDKSVWVAVTILSILMTGGAFLPLDPAHPTSRHEEILAEVEASIFLCSPHYCNRYSKAVKTVIPISKETIQAYGALKNSATLPNHVSSSTLAYALFTSGSTGRPKGIIIEHRAVVSSVTAFGPIVNLNPASRVLQFASLTFDAAILEVLGTLLFGGCICFPSEDERLNDAAGAIRRMNVSWTLLTPAIAGIIEPSAVPSLKTIACGGEAVPREIVTKWVHSVDLLIAYGPTETSIIASINSELSSNRDPACIGRGIPCTVTWVVDPENHNRLAPLGAVGELALEGPALAREYLKNPEKTAEAFVDEPAWTAAFPTGTSYHRRIYKTGDLVKYNTDGTLVYMGRKDHQVKLHGQRFELLEVEFRLKEDSRVHQAVVVLPKVGLLQKRLVAILSLKSLSPEDGITSGGICELVGEHDLMNLAYSELLGIQKNLEAQLPTYMVPQTWAVIKKVPMLVSGKLDRKTVTNWVENADDSLYDRIMQDYDVIKRSKVEETTAKPDDGAAVNMLQEILAQVLNLPSHKIYRDQSFVGLGGDSITGMAVISRARKQGLSLALHDILQSSSVRELAETAGSSLPVSRHEERTGEHFDLSPIQELYFLSADAYQGAGHFNQSMTVRVTRRIEPTALENAVKAIINQHSMLRSRFSRTPTGEWRQSITNEIDSSYRLRLHSIKKENEITPMVAQSQGCLDVQNGPIVAADLFEICGANQVLFLVANHLCVDMVSWRIILQDIQEFVDSGSLSPEKPLSFKNWCELQLDHSKKDVNKFRLPSKMETPNLSYWGMENSPNVYGDIKIEGFTLDDNTTDLLLGKCHDALRTEAIDILLSAVIHSFHRVFTDRRIPTIYNEGHGREPWDSSIDLSRTVGWFTTLCPLDVQVNSDDILNTIKRVKDTRRKVPDNGRSYFAQNLLHERKQSSSTDFVVPLEIIFNYLGRLQQLERGDSLFQHYGSMLDDKDFDAVGDMGRGTPRFALLEISAIVIQEKLHVSFTYNRNMSRESQICRWISECKNVLEKDIPQLKDTAHELTLSDYPLLPITYGELESLARDTFPRVGVNSKDQVEDIYPCSPMQEGILFSQLRDPSAYIFHTVFEVKDSQTGRTDLGRLREAWQTVVDRHPILRTVFIDSNYSGGSFDQLVLRKLNDNVHDLECDDSEALETLEANKLRELNDKRVPKSAHQLTICNTFTGRVLIKLEINHAVIDGGSIGVLLRDFALAYDNQLPKERGPLYSDYIKYIRTTPQDRALAHWTHYMNGVKPCHVSFANETKSHRRLKAAKMKFGRFPELQRFCEKHSVTLANLTLSAWAIVLHHFTGSDDVCFGYPSAGRDAPVPGIQDAVGIFINMLCCRVKFADGQTLSDISRMVQEDYISSLPYQSCSLASIQHELGLQGQALFNTTLSIQNHSEAGGSKGDHLSFTLQKAYDPSEYPVTVNVETARDREGIVLRYWTDAMSETQAKGLADAIAQVFTCFIERPSEPISELDILVDALQGRTHRPHKLSRPIRGDVNGTAKGMDSNSIQKLIDDRVHEVISQMLRNGQFAIPIASEVSSMSSNGVICNENHSTGPVDTLSRGPAEDNKKSAEIEKKLWNLWSLALGLPPSNVKPRDSFFKLGGDSIAAMKMVSIAREQGLALTVADIFNNPVFEDMVTAVGATVKSHTRDEPQIKKESEQPTENKTVLTESLSSKNSSTIGFASLDDMSLQSRICPKVGVFKGGIADVLPTTDFQALSITATLFKSRWMLNYFYLDGKGPLDLKRLREACMRVVESFDILRTVFVCVHGQFFQVVLRKLRPGIFVYETDESLDEFTESLQRRDREREMRQGEQYVQFFIVKKKDHDHHRILIRMSHTQFDGVCLSKIMSALKMAYEGSPLPPGSSFAHYMRLLPGTITPEHYHHWTTLLKGSKMPEIIQREGPNKFQHIGSFTELRKTVDVPPNALGNVTIATLVQSAWALTLAKLCSQSDVVFGLTINGRNTTVPGVENTVGPCVNVIPVRVKFDNKWTALDLFRYLQDQQVANMPYESLGFREIIRHCTDWPDWTSFSTSVFHQNVDYEGQMQLDNTQYRMGGAGVLDSFSDLTLVSKQPSSDKLDITMGYSPKSAIHPSFASKALDMVCETVDRLTSNPNAILPSPSTLRSLPSQTIPDHPGSSEEQFLSSHLKNRSIAELLVHSDMLAKSWQQVLPRRSAQANHQKTVFQLDSSFFDLGGDIFNMAQLAWLLDQEGLHVRIEDLLEHPSFLGHMAVLALHNDTSVEKGVGSASEGTLPVERGLPSLPDAGEEKLENKKRTWGRAVTLARKITKRKSFVLSWA